MKRISLFAIIAALTLTGCASPSAPMAERFPEASQKKLMAAQQWGAIAADVAAQTKANVDRQDFLMGRPLYVVPFSKAPFDQAFTNYMITSLVNAGLPVSTKPEGAVEVKYETQMIFHKTSLDPRSEGYVPIATIGTTGAWLLREAAVKNAVRLAAATTVAAAAAFDMARAQIWPTDVELLITTSITDQDQYLQRSTDAYYIEKAEAELFTPPPELEPVSALEAKPRVSREWKVTQ